MQDENGSTHWIPKKVKKNEMNRNKIEKQNRNIGLQTYNDNIFYLWLGILDKLFTWYYMGSSMSFHCESL